MVKGLEFLKWWRESDSPQSKSARPVRGMPPNTNETASTAYNTCMVASTRKCRSGTSPCRNRCTQLLGNHVIGGWATEDL
jgi:hypothetical protein